MADDVERMVLQMSANLRGFENEMRRMRQVTDRRLAEVENRARQSDRNLSRIMEHAGQGMVEALRNSLSQIAPTLAAAFSAQQVVQYADAWTQGRNALAAAGIATQDLSDRQNELVDLANETRTGTTETIALYRRLTIASRELGTSQEDVARLTELLNKAFQSSGASTQEAAAAALQLSQALAAGVLQGDELRSIRENAPIIAQAIADAMGVSVGALKELGAEGKITGKIVSDAILAAGDRIEAMFGATTVTVGQALQILDNELGRFVGSTDASASASERMAQAIVLLAKSLETARDVVLVAATVIGTTLAARALGQAAVGFTALRAQIALTNAQLVAFELQSGLAAGAVGRMTTAGVAATGAMRGLGAGMAFFGGPLGLAITGIATGISLLAFSSANAKREAEALTAEIERQAKAAGTAAQETAALKGEITATQTWVAQMTGEVDKLADAHYRAAAGAKAQAVETARLRLEEASKTLGDAQTAYASRRSINNQTESAVSTPYGTTRRIGGDGNLGDARTVQSQEFRNLQAQTATVRQLTQRVRSLISSPLASFTAEPRSAGGGKKDGKGSKSSGPTPEELARQRELLALQGQIELLRAQGRTAEADTVQRRLDIANLEKQYADAGIENARAAAELQVNAVAQAEAAARGRVTAQERANELLDMAVEAQRRQNDELLDRVSLEAELARLSGDPRRIEMAERDLYITQRVNDLLRDRVGLITEADRQAAERQAGGEYDALYTADLTGRVRDEIVDGLRDGLRSLAEGDVAGFFVSVADRFTDRILDNLAEDLADIVMSAFKGQAGGQGGGWMSSIFSALAGKRATGGSVTAGQPYLVGERRPEVFVPNVNGTVIPSVNAAMNRAQAARTVQAAPVVRLFVEEGAMFAPRVAEVSGPIALQTAATGVSYTQHQARTAASRRRQSFVG